jgi:hypothetical protein
LENDEKNISVFWYVEKPGAYSDYLGKSNYERIGISPFITGEHELYDYYEILYKTKYSNSSWMGNTK